jgi:hypothetical protein
MTEFPACLFIVTVEVDADVEADWNRWYDEVHLPDALACPGVLRGRRYKSAAAGSETARGDQKTSSRTVYTTVYELAGPEALQTPQFKAMRGWYQFTPHVVSRSQVFTALGETARAAAGTARA